MGKNNLFYVGNTSLTQGDFLRSTLEECRSMDIELFIEDISIKYDVEIKKERTIATAKLAGLYYDSIMEKIYYDKEDYYDEI